MPDARPLTPITESNTTTPRGSKFVDHDEWSTSKPRQDEAAAGQLIAMAVSNLASHENPTSSTSSPPPSPMPGARISRSLSRTPVQKRPYTSHNYVSTRGASGSPSPTPALSDAASLRPASSMASINSSASTTSGTSASPPKPQPAIGARRSFGSKPPSTPPLPPARATSEQSIEPLLMTRRRTSPIPQAATVITAATEASSDTLSRASDSSLRSLSRAQSARHRQIQTQTAHVPSQSSPSISGLPLSSLPVRSASTTMRKVPPPLTSLPLVATPEIDHASSAISSSSTATARSATASTASRTPGTPAVSASTISHAPSIQIAQVPPTPTRIPVRLAPSTTPARTQGTGVGTTRASSPTPLSPQTSLSVDTGSHTVQHGRRSPTPFRMARSASALDAVPIGKPAPIRQASIDLPPRPTTAADTRPRPSSTCLSRPSTNSSPNKDRPFTFHGLSPSIVGLNRRNSLLKSYGSKQLDQLDPSIAALVPTTESLEVTKEAREPGPRPSASRSNSRERGPRRVSFTTQSRPVAQPSAANTSPTDEEKRRPGSALARRSSTRLQNLLSQTLWNRFNKSAEPSPLAVFSQLPDVNGEECTGEEPIRSLIRTSNRFGIDDDDDHRHYVPSLHHHEHEQTSEGSIIEGPPSRVLYAENPDARCPSDSHSDSDHERSDHALKATHLQLPSLVHSESDSALSTALPSISGSSSEFHVSDTSLPFPTSPCSTAHELHLYEHMLYYSNNHTHAAYSILSSVHPQSHSETETLAASVFREANTMSQISRVLESMAFERYQLHSRLMEHADRTARSEDRSTRSLGLAALGLHNMDQAPSLARTSSSRRSSLNLTPTPANVSTRHVRHVSLPVTLPPAVEIHTSSSLPSLTDALEEFERSIQDGSAHQRTCEEAWKNIMAALKREGFPKAQLRDCGTQTDLSDLPGVPTERSSSRPVSVCLVPRLASTPPHTPIEPKRTPSSRRPSIATVFKDEDPMAGETLREPMSSPLGSPPSSLDPADGTSALETPPQEAITTPPDISVHELCEEWTPPQSEEITTPLQSEEIVSSPSTDEWGLLEGENVMSPLELSPSLSPTSPISPLSLSSELGQPPTMAFNEQSRLDVDPTQLPSEHTLPALGPSKLTGLPTPSPEAPATLPKPSHPIDVSSSPTNDTGRGSISSRYGMLSRRGSRRNPTPSPAGGSDTSPGSSSSGGRRRWFSLRWKSPESR